MYIMTTLGVIKFDIRLVASYFFKDIHLLLILKCHAHDLELPLIDIIACDMLEVVQPEEFVVSKILDASSFVNLP